VAFVDAFLGDLLVKSAVDAGALDTSRTLMPGPAPRPLSDLPQVILSPKGLLHQYVQRSDHEATCTRPSAGGLTRPRAPTGVRPRAIAETVGLLLLTVVVTSVATDTFTKLLAREGWDAAPPK